MIGRNDRSKLRRSATSLVEIRRVKFISYKRCHLSRHCNESLQRGFKPWWNFLFDKLSDCLIKNWLVIVTLEISPLLQPGKISSHPRIKRPIPRLNTNGRWPVLIIQSIIIQSYNHTVNNHIVNSHTITQSHSHTVTQWQIDI